VDSIPRCSTVARGPPLARGPGVRARPAGGFDGYEVLVLSHARRQIHRLYIPDSGAIVFVLVGADRKAAVVPRLEAMVERSVRHGHRLVEAQDVRLILRLTGEELLTVRVADLGVRLHDDPRFGAVHAARPGARGVRTAVGQVRFRIFAEVPD